MKKSATIIMTITFTLMISNLTMAGGRNHYDRGYNNHHYGGPGRGGYYAGPFLGGLIAGGIIGSSLNNPYYRRPVYVNTYPATITTGSNFLLKSNGDCFLITNNSNGNQILSSVPGSNCK